MDWGRVAFGCKALGPLQVGVRGGGPRTRGAEGVKGQMVLVESRGG